VSIKRTLENNMSEKKKRQLTFARLKPNPQEVTVGSDPELFVVDGQGEMIPAFKFLPSAAEAKATHKKLFWDGFQAEMIPCNSGEFCLNLLMDDI
jgi:hypothetical protein